MFVIQIPTVQDKLVSVLKYAQSICSKNNTEYWFSTWMLFLNTHLGYPLNFFCFSWPPQGGIPLPSSKVGKNRSTRSKNTVRSKRVDLYDGKKHYNGSPEFRYQTLKFEKLKFLDTFLSSFQMV